jgi:hypothetical protein
LNLRALERDIEVGLEVKDNSFIRMGFHEVSKVGAILSRFAVRIVKAGGGVWG